MTGSFVKHSQACRHLTGQAACASVIHLDGERTRSSNVSLRERSAPKGMRVRRRARPSKALAMCPDPTRSGAAAGKAPMRMSAERSARMDLDGLLGSTTACPFDAWIGWVSCRPAFGRAFADAAPAHHCIFRMSVAHVERDPTMPGIVMADTNSHRSALMCPASQADGHATPGLIDALVPGVAAMIEAVGVGLEDPVAEPVLAHDLPEGLDRVQLGRARRQGHQGGGVGDDGFVRGRAGRPDHATQRASRFKEARCYSPTFHHGATAR